MGYCHDTLHNLHVNRIISAAATMNGFDLFCFIGFMRHFTDFMEFFSLCLWVRAMVLGTYLDVERIISPPPCMNGFDQYGILDKNILTLPSMYGFDLPVYFMLQ